MSFGQFSGGRNDRPVRRQVRLELEALEGRVVPYAASGNLWPHPELVTISFMPDGTNLGGPTSNLFAAFNAAFGSAAAWQNVILKAAQTWAQQTNLNFTVVPDNGTDSGSGNFEQGDPAIGDIRFGGFAFGNSSLLALGYMPPSVNNYSIAGDIAINTAQIFNINGNDYDLYTVITHELGHALGLDHSSSALAVMYSTYEGVDSHLGADDIAGIQSIYGGPRQPDSFDAAGSNGTFATASDITPWIDNTSLIAQVPNLNITTTSDIDFYKFSVPASFSGPLTVTVQSRGLSLLAPSMRVYNSNDTQVAAATGTGELGSTLTATINVTSGQEYYVRVAGANTTAFGTGAYGLVLNFGGGAGPAIQPPNTSTPNGNPLNGGGGVANRRDANGVSVSSLLIGLDRTTYNLLGGGLLGGLGGSLISGLVDYVVSSAVDLPFVDAYSVTPTIHTGVGRGERSLSPQLPSFVMGAPLPGNSLSVSVGLWTANPGLMANTLVTSFPVDPQSPPWNHGSRPPAAMRGGPGETDEVETGVYRDESRCDGADHEGASARIVIEVSPAAVTTQLSGPPPREAFFADMARADIIAPSNTAGDILLPPLLISLAFARGLNLPAPAERRDRRPLGIRSLGK